MATSPTPTADASTPDDRERDLSARIDEVEIRLSYLDRHLGELDEVVREVADRVVDMGRAIKRLDQQLSDLAEVDSTDGPPA